MSKRTQIVAGNWKMNGTTTEAKALVSEIIKQAENYTCKVILSPPTCYLSSVQNDIKTSTIECASQNVFHEENGAFTGEISVSMLNDLAVKYAIIGHSERRQIDTIQESNKFINQKVIACQTGNITPILCVGETEKEKLSKITKDVIKTQLEEGLKNIPKPENIIIAYEPVWAIGTGLVATPDQAQDVHSFIRNFLTTQFTNQISQKTSILYGGSVKANNIKDIIQMKDIDGALVGGASLKAKEFIEIIKLTSQFN